LAHPSSTVRALRAARQLGLPLLFALLPLACARTESPAPAAEAPRPAQALTEAERVAPQVQGDRLCQAALGFSVAFPGESFRRDTETEASLNTGAEKAGEGEDSIWWAWSTNSQAFHLLAAKGAAASSESFARFLAGRREKVHKADGLSILKDEAVTDAPPYSWVLETQSYNAQSFYTVCLSPPAPTETSAVVCIRTLTNSPGELRKERESIAFGPCYQ